MGAEGYSVDTAVIARVPPSRRCHHRSADQSMVRRERRNDAALQRFSFRIHLPAAGVWEMSAQDDATGSRRACLNAALNERADDLTDDDAGVAAFLTLGDDVVRNLLDVLQRLDRLRGVIEDTKSTLLQLGSARIDLRDLVVRLETDLRSANTAMLAIASNWLMSSPERGGPLTIRSTR